MKPVTLFAFIVLIQCPTAHAWHDEGHVYAALAAVESLPDDVPAFFREGAATVAHGSVDPDVIRLDAVPQLRDTDAPDHFIDLEYLRGNPLPPTRDGYRRLCAELGVDPQKAGMLPYAIAEWGQRLTVAFAEYRRWPDNPHIQMKCLVYAGVLSHFTADAAMPLHTTVHYDGRIEDGGGSPHTGIHARVDALPTKLPFDTIFVEPLPGAEASDDLLALADRHIRASHDRLDAVYKLEAQVPALANPALDDDAVVAFTRERMRHAAGFTADVFYSAWLNSAQVELPFWIDRAVFDEDLDRSAVPVQPAAP